MLSFFNEFLLRNHVFAGESKVERGFKRAQDVIDLAQVELILTSKIAKDLPDAFGEGCREIWGRRESSLFSVPPAVPFSEPAPITPPEEVVDVNMTDAPSWGDSSVPDDGAWGENAAPWGESNPIPIADEWTTSDPVEWLAAPGRCLLNLLGPTTIIETHAPGVAEWSIRRIKDIQPPTPNIPKSPILATGSSPDPEVIESELEGRLARVVMSPWTGWEHYTDWRKEKGNPGDSMAPRILDGSRGPVIMPGEAEVAHVGDVHPHNPSTDDITILVANDVVPTLKLGMGIAANWVQLAWREDVEGAVEKVTKKKKKSKGRLLKAGERYWYCEHPTLTSPSFHVVPSRDKY